MCRFAWMVLSLGMIAACGEQATESTGSAPVEGQPAEVASTCTGTWPSYWQDPHPKFAEQWEGQPITNQPPTGWAGPVFQLSDAYPQQPVNDEAAQPWRAAKFDALFSPETPQATRESLAEEYAWEVMEYIQAGNIGNENLEDDWNVCENPVRPWFHMPFQTYDALTGREFTHGLTREAPVTFNLADAEHPEAGLNVNSTMWAVGIYNATAAYTLGQVWKGDGTVAIPTSDLSFDEGSVVGKPLFNTDSPEQFTILANMPAFQANISDPSYCTCTPSPGESSCTLAEEAEQCGRSTSAFGPVSLLQFDIAVKDSRAPGTQWVFGTFVADGVRKASEPEPWDRISPLGLMWGNATPPAGQLAADYPSDPRQNGFDDIVIFWDTVDMLNAAGGPVPSKAPGHLGCNSRLNGPADNANSSCMSCHGTASVPDSNIHTPPIITQFSGGAVTSECVTPDSSDPSKGYDATMRAATAINDVTFAEVDGLWFADTPAASPFNATLQTASGPKNVLEGQPDYADGTKTWIATDYSLQMSGALGSWMQWQLHAAALEADAESKRVWSARVPRRGMLR